MFRVKVNENEYNVTFTHAIPSPCDYENLPSDSFRKFFGTKCDIELTTDRNIGWFDWSDLSIHDQFNRSIGRKVSLTKALQSAFPGEANKSVRKLFWDAYYKARGDKW